MNRKLLLVIIASFSLLFGELKAQKLSESSKISILTCEPGKEVYSMYGHTAIRVIDPEFGIDYVFNYGVFSFESPNFIYRFAKGQTDYQMVGQSFQSFITEYETDKRSVFEQVLNLNHEGKNILFNALIENAKPENKIYRYNFFIDNCATRVRDMIENNTGNQVNFSKAESNESYRSLIKYYHKPFSWVDLGIDLLVGQKAEVKITEYGQMFLPEYLFEQFAKAGIIVDGEKLPLVKETNTLLKYPNNKLKKSFPWPTIVLLLAFIVTITFSLKGIRSEYKNASIDYWLFGLSGFAGIIIAWFTLFSEHPAMSPNFNLLWALPSNLVFAIVWKFKKYRNISKFYLYVVLISLFGLLLVTQDINIACILFLLSIIVRASYILATKSKIFIREQNKI